MITGYGHFAQLADSLQWDETAIDLSADAQAWSQLDDAERDLHVVLADRDRDPLALHAVELEHLLKVHLG